MKNFITNINKTTRGENHVALKNYKQTTHGTGCHVDQNSKTREVNQGFVESVKPSNQSFKGESYVKVKNLQPSSRHTQCHVHSHHAAGKVDWEMPAECKQQNTIQGKENDNKKYNTLRQSYSFNAGSYFETGYSEMNTLGLTAYKLQGMKQKMESEKTWMVESCFVPACRECACRTLQRLTLRENVTRELACVSTLYCI